MNPFRKFLDVMQYGDNVHWPLPDGDYSQRLLSIFIKQPKEAFLHPEGAAFRNPQYLAQFNKDQLRWFESWTSAQEGDEKTGKDSIKTELKSAILQARMLQQEKAA